MAPIRTLNHFQQAVSKKNEARIRETANLARIGQGFREAIEKELSNMLVEGIAESKSDLEASGVVLTYKLGTALVESLASEKAVLVFLMVASSDASSVPKSVPPPTAGGTMEYSYNSWNEFEAKNEIARFIVKREGILTWRVVRIEARH